MRGVLPLLVWGWTLVVLMVSVESWKVRPVSSTFNPVPDPRAVIVLGSARFTVLTSRLIRLEHSPNGKFVDEASLTMINRLLPVPSFTSKQSGETLVINTGDLELHYDKILGFEALRIIFSVNGTNSTWYPEKINFGNLKGTRRSLDCRDDFPPGCTKSFPLDPGLLSTDGWVLFDDSDTPLFNYSGSDGIPWITMPRARNGGGICVDCHDWYFFGYGLDYTQALYDFSTLSGPIALPPASAFGSWWSRYYAYSESQFIDEIIDGYKNHSLPLNHVVLDMNWHIEPDVPHCNPSGGFTWNTQLFPSPPSFIDFLHQPGNDLKLLLNPQYGIDACQATYPAFAEAIGFDSSKNETIPCDFMSHLVATNQFSIVMDPVGNDYWWTDFDGCHHREDIDTHQFGILIHITDLLWSNHVFYYEKAVKGIRPLTLSRYGGPGNQRYPVGFSGDTYAFFSTLEFEVYFTSTAANILFGYWSHDTGGFRDEPSDELFLRWLQFAAVEPIYRIHSDHEERRIWEFPSYELMKDTMLLRNALGPYIYTQARRAYDTAISLVHPHYYDFPLVPEAYNYPYQYILAAPVVTPVDNSTNTTTKVLWLPPGNWIDFSSFQSYTGPMELSLTVGLPDLPLFVVAGAIIPLKTMDSVTNYNPDPLIFAIFPGAEEANTTYYEDDGNTTQYLDGVYSFMSASYTTQGNTTKAFIGAFEGTFTGQPTSRTYQVALKGVLSSPSSVTVNGIPCGPAPTQQGQGWWVDTTDLVALVVQLSPSSPLSSSSIIINL